MRWKNGSGKDLKPDTGVSPLDLENLDLVKPFSLAMVKSTQLKQVGIWVSPPKSLQGEDSGSVSRAREGI